MCFNWHIINIIKLGCKITYTRTVISVFSPPSLLSPLSNKAPFLEEKNVPLLFLAPSPC